MPSDPANIQSGQPAPERARDTPPTVARADEREGAHYEADPDQIVKIVHQVRPIALPVEGPTDYVRQGGLDDASVTDVRVTPASASVHEATPED